jgi:hypothetical protein
MRNSYSPRLLVVLCLVALSGPARCLGWFGSDNRTLSQHAVDSTFIVYGVLELPPPREEQSSDEVIVTDIVKSHRLAGGLKVLRLSSKVRIEDRKDPPRYLIYCDLFKGKIDPYRVVSATPAVVPYLKGLLAIDARDPVRWLRYCFDYLEHADNAIAQDAYDELNSSPRRELCRTARTFPPARLRRLVSAAGTPPARLPLYALLLGCCGGDEDASLLRKLADRYAGEKAPRLFDEVLVGYTLLRPKNGRALAHSLLEQPLRPFMVRYSVLRMALFFDENRLDGLSRAQAVGLVRTTLDQEDINDIAIEYLRQWRCWKDCEDVLSASARTAITRRAILLYALQCPGPRAADYVTKARARDPDRVKDAEELLKLEEKHRVPPK